MDYQTMWHLLRFDFLEMVNEVYQNKILSNSQRKGMIRLIFKKTDRTDLRYYRPISLLNLDVKIIAKTLALRLGKVLPTIVSEDQTCIPGRNIAKKLHTLNDVIRYGNSKNIEAVILFLDQEKAFDRVSHEFLLKTLRHLNFGDYFVSWVQIMLKDVTSQIKVNGFLTEDIDISRGVRQGDPLSALLYVLIAEVLGNQIRSNQNIKGITIRDKEQKILQYADDTKIFVTNDSSIKETFKELEKYEKATGAKINIEKTEGLFIGKWRNRHDKPFDGKWTNDKVMALGLWVGNTDTSELISREQMSKVRNKLQFWRARGLSVIGRVRVENVFVLSRLWHRTEIFSIPPTIVNEVEKDILDFVWANKKREINKDLLMSDISCGGLRLVKIQNKINAQRILWAVKLWNMKDGCFTKQVANSLIGVNDG